MSSPTRAARAGSESAPRQGEQEATAAQHGPTVGQPSQEAERIAGESLEVWRDRALRLQAEMENFRKRQTRLAEEQVRADRERLLRSFLDVSDNLERALAAEQTDVASLRQGVSLTHQSLKRIVENEGVRPIEAQGQPFDPTYHEAVGTIPHQRAGTEPNTVVEVVRAGHRLGDRLLRPARVIVAA